MKRFFCLVLTCVCLLTVLCACSSEKSDNIFDTIDFKDSNFSIGDVTIGKSTFADLEKIYPEVDIGEIQSLSVFKMPYTLIVDDTTVEMTKSYGLSDFTDPNQNQIADYDEVKDVKIVSMDMLSNETFDKESAENLVDVLAERCKEKFGEPTETSESPPTKYVNWELEEGKNIGVSTMLAESGTKWYLRVMVYYHPSQW